MRIEAPPGLVAWTAGPLVSLLARTWRIETVAEPPWSRIERDRIPYVLLCWHDGLLPLLWQHRHRGITMVVSEARDGRYLAAYARRLGYREAWGSSTRGGVRAMLGAVRALRAGGGAAFTPDGPRGPRRAFKGGALLAAQRGAAEVIPMHAGAERGWRLSTWDRMLVPKPFARVRVAYGDRFRVEPGEAGLAAARERALVELAAVVREVQWDDGATPTG
jgi:lysophospholipid acyltransferase (LPLAT)-like uncharacterized protein